MRRDANQRFDSITGLLHILYLVEKQKCLSCLYRHINICGYLLCNGMYVNVASEAENNS